MRVGEQVKERDLFFPAKNFLENEIGCEKVYAEVADIDVVGKKGNIYIGIELKTTLNFKVLEQADRRKYLVDYMFILVPEPKRYHSYLAYKWLKEMGVGLMYYNPKNEYIFIFRWGKRIRISRDYNISRYIDEELHIQNVGGSKGGEILTPYKHTINKIKEYLFLRERWCSIEEILESIQTHYKNPKPSTVATLRANWNEDWVEYQWIDGKLCFRMKDEYREIYKKERFEMNHRYSYI